MVEALKTSKDGDIFKVRGFNQIKSIFKSITTFSLLWLHTFNHFRQKHNNFIIVHQPAVIESANHAKNSYISEKKLYMYNDVICYHSNCDVMQLMEPFASLCEVVCFRSGHFDLLSVYFPPKTGTTSKVSLYLLFERCMRL